MSVTQTRLFDPVVFDDNVFDTRTNYLVTLEETRQLFDEAVFDSNVFDTNRGGVVDTTDSVANQFSGLAYLTENVPIGQTVTRVLTSLRSMTESSTINLTDSVLGILQTIRNATESISVSASVNYITPTVVRRLFDKGRLFDLNIFDNTVYLILILNLMRLQTALQEVILTKKPLQSHQLHYLITYHA